LKKVEIGVKDIIGSCGALRSLVGDEKVHLVLYQDIPTREGSNADIYPA
jgi:hypothetical protein